MLRLQTLQVRSPFTFEFGEAGSRDASPLDVVVQLQPRVWELRVDSAATVIVGHLMCLSQILGTPVDTPAVEASHGLSCLQPHNPFPGEKSYCHYYRERETRIPWAEFYLQSCYGCAEDKRF